MASLPYCSQGDICAMIVGKTAFLQSVHGSRNTQEKNAYKKRKNENFEKQKKNRFFLMFQGSLNPKIRFLGQKV